MKFAIQINEGPYQHQASDSAYLFTKAALEKGHEIFRVFFYHDGAKGAVATTAKFDLINNFFSAQVENTAHGGCGSF